MANIFEPRFLPASLYIEAILRSTTIAGRREILKSIKDGSEFGGAYDATLERIKTQREGKAKVAMAALTWVCHSERPLQVDELCHALAVEIGAAHFDPENVPSIGTLLDCCQGLIMVDAEASIVRLIHYTVQEYLCSHPGLFSKPHSILAETCLTYLNSQQVKKLTSRSLPDNRSVPFLKYSSRHWGTHMKRDLSGNVRTLALELLNQYEGHISAVSLLEQVLHPRYTRGIATPLLFSALHCASFFGIVELVTVFINAEGYKADQQDYTAKTPLAWAARNGQEGVVKALLEQKNVDPNHLDKNDLTPLGWAAIEGHEGVVNLFLERENVDPNHADVNGRTPLRCAAFEGHEGVVKLLLEREDVDPNLPDKAGHGPLGCAAFAGHEGVVKLFLERENVDPDHPDKNSRTPLGWAAINGQEGIVKLLLDRRDVDPNRLDKHGSTPLSYAAGEGHESIMQLLQTRKSVETPDAQLPHQL